jgi:hypothetical protein
MSDEKSTLRSAPSGVDLLLVGARRGLTVPSRGKALEIILRVSLFLSPISVVKINMKSSLRPGGTSESPKEAEKEKQETSVT